MPKPKLTHEMVDEAVALAASGATNIDIIEYLGVSESAWYRWLKDPRSKPEHELCDRLAKAEIKRKLWHLRKIQDAADEGSWQASAWYLERRYPNQFSLSPSRFKTSEEMDEEKAVDQLAQTLVKIRKACENADD